jgi:uncharacterized membrane protein
MDVLAALLCVVVIVMLISLQSNMRSKMNTMEEQLLAIKDMLRKAAIEKANEPKPQPKSFTSDLKAVDWDAKIEQEPAAAPQPEVVKPPVETPKLSIIDEPVKKSQPVMDSSGKRLVIEPPRWTPPPPPEPSPSFFERYPDIEKFIGENLINKIGIAILVLAIGYFVKYAIDSNWIGPVGRVGIGFICGGILLGFAHKLRNNYNAFSSVLVGGGLAVFYFTVTLGFHQFNLFSQTAAFVILVVITAFAVALSLLYDRQELAIIALVGGLASPFMASNGSANYHALFVYMLVLNTGLLVIAYNKAWRILNFLAFVLSQLVYVSVLFTVDTKGSGAALLYGGIFYLLYFAINIANNVKENKKFIASDFGILLSNTAIYFAAGLYLLSNMDLAQYRGLFSAAMAVLNLVASYILLKNKKVDTNILYLLIGITITFISLTAPIQLHGNNVTLFWASEAVLLYWLYQKSGIALMRYTALGIWVIMLVSLLMDVSNFYLNIFAFTGNYAPVRPIIANKGFITLVYAAISTHMLWLLISSDDEGHSAGIRIRKSVFLVAAIVLLFLSGLLEINYQFSSRYTGLSLNVLYDLLYTTAFVLVFDLVAEKLQPVLLFDKGARFIIIALAIAMYLLTISNAFDVQAYILTKGILNAHLIAHWLSALIIIFLFTRIINLARTSGHIYTDLFAWVTSTGIILFLSLEVCLIANTFFFTPPDNLDHILENYIQTGLPVLWGLCSFALMWLGMRYKYKPLRIISLTTFSITLLKLFIFDLRNIPAAGKIIAFFCLGVLLLIISFMYQKVKKIIISDEDKPAV